MTTPEGWHRFVPNETLLRRLAPPQRMRCMCCGTFYDRGHFSCCAPPSGMASHNWLALACPMAPRGCGKCWHHCDCLNKRARAPKGPLRDLILRLNLTDGG